MAYFDWNLGIFRLKISDFKQKWLFSNKKFEIFSLKFDILAKKLAIFSRNFPFLVQIFFSKSKLPYPKTPKLFPDQIQYPHLTHANHLHGRSLIQRPRGDHQLSAERNLVESIKVG